MSTARDEREMRDEETGSEDESEKQESGSVIMAKVQRLAFGRLMFWRADRGEEPQSISNKILKASQPSDF